MNPIEKRIEKAICEVSTETATTPMEWAEKVVVLCQIKGLTTEDVLLGKTPKGIADIWMHRRISSHAPQVPPKEEDGTCYPLLPFSKIVHNAFIRDREAATRWTFPITLRAKEEEIDAERLSAAVEAAIANHPVLSMHITDEGEQWYERGFRTPYLSANVHKGEGHVLLSLSINRILGDATSFVLFAQNIWRAYKGESLPHDSYLSYLQQYVEHTKKQEYLKHGQWLAQRYDAPTYPLLPKQDSPEGGLPCDSNTKPYTVFPNYSQELTALLRRERISANAFFCLATTLAIMEYNGTEKAGLTWAYMGRETREEMAIFGSLHRDIPMTMTRTDTKAEMYGQLREQMEQGILHSDYPFTLQSPTDSPWHTAVNVLVQPSVAEAMEGCPVEFDLAPTERSSESYCMLDIEINLEPLTLTYNYSPQHYHEESIHRFANLIEKNANMLLE